MEFSILFTQSIYTFHSLRLTLANRLNKFICSMNMSPNFITTTKSNVNRYVNVCVPGVFFDPVWIQPKYWTNTLHTNTHAPHKRDSLNLNIRNMLINAMCSCTLTRAQRLCVIKIPYTFIHTFVQHSCGCGHSISCTRTYHNRAFVHHHTCQRHAHTSIFLSTYVCDQ